MANSPQAIKRARQAIKHYNNNRSQRTQMRTKIKAVLAAVKAGDHSAATGVFRTAAKYMDSLVNKNILHKNTAARYKSRLNAKVKAIA